MWVMNMVIFGRIAKGEVGPHHAEWCVPNQSFNGIALPEIKQGVPIQLFYDLGCEINGSSETQSCTYRP